MIHFFNFRNRNFITGLVFIVALLTVASFYNYDEIVSFRPQSVHKWRQSDCASLALNYYQGGMHIFQPEVHNLTSQGGTSGLAYTSEMPMYYYSLAILYKIFGPHEYIYRLINTLIFLLGLFYLHKLVLLMLKDSFWSIVIPLLFFTSPVLVYYGNNFLTNSSALSFSIMGWYFFTKYIVHRHSKWLLISLLLFFMAASFKLTAFFSFFAIGAILLLEFLGLKKFSQGKALFKKPLWFLVLMFMSFGIIVGWVFYAHRQNVANECYYFSTVTFPIWDLDSEGISKVLMKIKKVWWSQYFHLSMHIFLGLQFLFVAVHFKRLPAYVKWILAIVFVEVIVFMLTQFWTFADHDYYTIGLYIFPLLICLTSFYLLKANYGKVLHSFIFKGSVFTLLIFNMHYASGEMYSRYHGWWNDIEQYSDLHSIEPYLRELGISAHDTVISIPDNSHASLYLMNQKGWTEYTDAKFNRGARYSYNSDSLGIVRSKHNGAAYLIVNGINNLYEKKYLQSFSHHLKGRYKNTLIFDLHAADTNFSLAQRQVTRRYFCDAEALTSDDAFFLHAVDTFEYGNTQSPAYAYSGKFSSKLTESQPYGMTLKIDDLKFGESFKLHVYIKNMGNAKGEIVTSINGSANSENIIRDSLHGDWQYVETNIFIKEEYVGKELVLFLYNPSKDPAYFDDFEIIRYKSILENASLK